LDPTTLLLYLLILSRFSTLPFDGSSRLQDIDLFIHLRQHFAEPDLLTVRICSLLHDTALFKKLLTVEQ
jgi:hypothetical protein